MKLVAGCAAKPYLKTQWQGVANANLSNTVERNATQNTTCIIKLIARWSTEWHAGLFRLFIYNILLIYIALYFGDAGYHLPNRLLIFLSLLGCPYNPSQNQAQRQKQASLNSFRAFWNDPIKRGRWRRSCTGNSNSLKWYVGKSQTQNGGRRLPLASGINLWLKSASVLRIIRVKHWGSQPRRRASTSKPKSLRSN